MMPKRKSSVYAEPLVFPPLFLPHTNSFLLLHGRGSNGPKFGPELLFHPIPLPLPTPASTSSATAAVPVSHTTIRALFPHAKFIFPTASPRRATIYKRSIINQWFDNWHLSDPEARTELMGEGLRESSMFISNLVREETAAVGGPNVVLGGLSQGCAMTLITTLVGFVERKEEGETAGRERDYLDLGGVIGMCGWLPFAKDMEDLARPTERGKEEGDKDDLGFDPFDRHDGDNNGVESEDDKGVDRNDPVEKALSYLRLELDLPTTFSHTVLFSKTPFFLGHGVLDDRVPILLGRGAVSCLSAFDIDVEWREYEELGHWYSAEMLHDLALFLREKVGWKMVTYEQGMLNEAAEKQKQEVGGGGAIDGLEECRSTS